MGFSLLKDKQQAVLSHILLKRAMNESNRVVFTYLNDGLTPSHTLTYKELYDQAQAIAEDLRDCSQPGNRALLMFPAGLEFISAFFGCLYAGIIPVPIPELDPIRAKRGRPRFHAIVEDSQASTLLTTKKLFIGEANHSEEIPEISSMRRICVEDSWHQHLTNRNHKGVDHQHEIAFLQYTSGSTSSPKGVIVTQQCLVEQLKALGLTSGVQDESISLSWMPHFHDYGLVSGLLASVYLGLQTYIIPPMKFLRNPLVWLNAISKYQVTHSSGPNFAYDLCVTRTTPKARAGLDLRTWCVATCGAEPIRVETLDSFTRAFEPYGFSKGSFTPGYGLAEFTLVASIKPFGSIPSHLELEGPYLEKGSIVPVKASTRSTKKIVSVGCPLPETDIRIVDYKTRRQMSPDTVGEIWISGPCLAQGYWRKHEETLETFNAFTADSEEGPFLRTGDLGFIKDGQLYVTGRLKDLIIIRGNNYFPQDIEQTVQESHQDFRQGTSVAFSVSEGLEEQLVVIQEMRGNKTEEDLEGIALAIRQAVSLEHELPVYAVLLVRPGSVLKTTSGKIQRQACKEAFQAGRFESLYSSVKQSNRLDSFENALSSTHLLSLPSQERHESVATFVKDSIAHGLGLDRTSLNSDQHFSGLGIDSLMSAQLTCQIERATGVTLPPSTFLQNITIDALTRNLLDLLPDQIESFPTTVEDLVIPDTKYRLSPNQKAQWFLNQLDPKSPDGNVSVVLLIRQPLDKSAVQQTLRLLIARHSILRTIYTVQSGIPFQRILSDLDPFLEYKEVADLDWEEVKRDLIARNQQPFDLSQGPLLRAHLYERSSTSRLLLLSTHHIAADGWSLHLLVNDFVHIYAEVVGSNQLEKPETPADYISFSRWQTQMLEGAEGKKLLAFWEKQFTEELPKLNLTYGPIEPLHSPSLSASQRLTIHSELTHRLQGLAQKEGVTLYVILLAVFQVLLHRYTGQEDILICSPMSGRIRPEYLKTVGNVTNIVPLRETLTGNPSFQSLLHQVSKTVTSAIDHQGYPFSLLVEDLKAKNERVHLPIQQVLFILQNFKLFDDLNDPQMHGSTSSNASSLRDIVVDPFVIPQPTGQFDLTLELANHGSSLTGLFKYNSDLFDSIFVDRLTNHFQILLDGVSLSPDSRIWDFPLFQPNERQRVVVEWNPTPAVLPLTATAHELIEHQVLLSPNTIALVSENAELTFDELNTRANQVAHCLRLRGVGADIPIGICIERSVEMVVGILAILKAGGAYVPLDPHSPKTRLALILQDLKPPIILTTRKLQNNLPEALATCLTFEELEEDIAQQLDQNLTPSAKPQNLAYIIYTSGSTGRPKGVQIEHQALVAYAQSFSKECSIKEGDRVLQFSSLAFDASVEEIFPFLFSGGTIVLPTEMTVESPEKFLATCSEFGVTILDLPTAYWHDMTLHLEKHDTRIYPSLRLMIIGGEKASPRAVQVWKKKVEPSIRLLNTYGPTEATVTATTYDLTNCLPDDVSLSNNIPIGRPLAHVKAYVLDPYLQSVPIGLPGELCLGGHSLARGYHDRSEETAKHFIHDPLSTVEGSRLFKTGDLCRYRQDGNLEYLGRTDHQVKLRGFRVELGEIEAVIQEHPGVYEALVILKNQPQLGPRLMAYFIPVRQPGLPPRELRTFLKERLPEHMIPSMFMAMDSWPRTLTGKIDRSLLPEIDETQLDAEEHYVAPRGPIEEAVAEQYCTILGLSRVGSRDHFFELGGHSLLAVQLVSRLREIFQCDISLRVFFENPTVDNLAKAIQAVLHGETPRDTIPAITPVPKDRPLPLSSSQERIYFIHKLAPESAAYNIPVAIRLHGTLNQLALEESLNKLIQRHESLRTSFHEESGTPTQVITSLSGVNLEYIDLRHVPHDLRLEKAHEKAEESVRRPFELSTAPLLRAALFQLNDDDHVLTVTVHHLVTDQWSFAILGKELGQFYNTLCENQSVNAKPLPLQYGDFAFWQRQWLNSEVLERQYSYWKNKLADLPILELPTNYPRLPEQTFTGTYINLDLMKPLLNKLQNLSATENSTLYMLCLAAFKLLLNRYSGQTDIVIGSPVANRHWFSVENMVGTFVNTLVLRTDLSGDPTFRELLQRVRQVALEGYANQDLPFEKLVQDLAPARTLGSMPLVQVLFNFGNAPFERVKFTGLSIGPFEIDRGASQFDLSLSIDTMSSGTATLEFNTDLFDHDHMTLFLAHYHELLQSIVATPDVPISTLSMLTPTEKQKILGEWNMTDTPLPKGVSTIDAFELQVTRSPDSLAIISEETTFTYKELNDKANQLALSLRRLGVGQDFLVGVAINRTADLPIVLLGIMKAGGAYLPLDPQGPSERLAFMLQNSKAPILITQPDLKMNIPDYQGTFFHLDREMGASVENRDLELPAHSNILQSNLAYVIYTSGSTGQPKGVEIEHGALINFLYSMSRKLAVTSTDVFLAVTPVTFDIAALELFLPLLVGARVVLVSGEEARDGQRLMKRIQASEATVMQATPATWRMLLQAGWEGNFKLKVLCGGEDLPRELADELLTRSREVWNLYGPTETTIWSTVQKVCPGIEPVSIGRPIDNTRTLILDKNSQLTPVGIPGELYIGGGGVARGYLGRPDLTTERFQSNPFGWPEERLYKTGDIAKWRPDGSIDYLGRNDQQVKIRGVRMELPEIEARLNLIPAIRQSVVLAIDTNQSDKKLVAFVIPSSDPDLDIEQIRRHIRPYLPAPMIPSEFVILTEFPLTPNGKVDRKALAPMRGKLPDKRVSSALPENNLHRQLIRVWERLLDIQGIGIDDHYFDLGGHSILALQLFTEIEQLTGIRLPLATLFKAPTIRKLASVLQSNQPTTNWQSLVLINPNGVKPPLFAVPGIGGNVVGFYELAQLLGGAHPFYGLQSRGLDGQAEPFSTVEDIATHFVSEIKKVQSSGPYFLIGACIGGIVAWEMAQQLSAKGEKVALLAMLETWPPHSLQVPRWTLPNFLRAPTFFFTVSFRIAAQIFRSGRKEGVARLFKALRGLREMVYYRDVYRGDREILFRDKVSEANRKAAANYAPQPFSGRIELIIASERPVNPPKDTRRTWCNLALGGYSVDEIPADNTGHLFTKPNVHSLAEKLKTLIETAQGKN